MQQASIQTNYVLQANRQRFDKYLHDTAVNNAFSVPLDSNTEYDYASACYAVTQFMIKSPHVEAGLRTLFNQYDSLQYSTKAAFLESLYGLYPGVYEDDVKKLLLKETNPRLFAMQALYLFAGDATPIKGQTLLAMLNKHFPGSQNNILRQLKDYITNHSTYLKTRVPPLNDLFNHQKELHQKTIYSLQRWNRDYPGLAVLQNADGSFARDSAGRLLVFQQLARAASNLPYFITDGNTPQGIFSITGLDISHNNFLGPTPNIQMVMPFEDDEAYWGDAFDNTKDSLTNYLNQLPSSWQHYTPITEAYYAGRVGRSAVIAHGTTLNPDYFKGKSYYPISPTAGCLCAKEIWNTDDGHLLESAQLNMINAFLATPGDIGYMIVINIDDKHAPVSTEEVEKLVRGFEGK